MRIPEGANGARAGVTFEATVTVATIEVVRLFSANYFFPPGFPNDALFDRFKGLE